MVATLGPEAWPAPALEAVASAVDAPRHLHPLLRDQRAIAGIGRSWVDEILWDARLSPFKKGSDLEPDEVERLHAALAVLGLAIDHYEDVIGDNVPDKPRCRCRCTGERGAVPALRDDPSRSPLRRARHDVLPGGADRRKIYKDRRLSRLLREPRAHLRVIWRATACPIVSGWLNSVATRPASVVGSRAMPSWRRTVAASK